jgi:hypothetical protein
MRGFAELPAMRMSNPCGTERSVGVREKITGADSVRKEGIEPVDFGGWVDPPF